MGVVDLKHYLHVKKKNYIYDTHDNKKTRSRRGNILFMTYSPTFPNIPPTANYLDVPISALYNNKKIS